MVDEEGAPKFPGFPFEPYSIQTDFMNSLYQSLNQGGVSMLESPTGEWWLTCISSIFVSQLKLRLLHWIRLN